MFNIRYHIVSLIAVFLALTIGLLLGSLITDKGVLSKQQRRLMEGIKQDVQSVLERNKTLEAEVKQLKEFRRQVGSVAVANRLVDKKILVMSLSKGQEGLYADLAKFLTKAGAKSTHLTVNLSKLDFSDQQLVTTLSASIDESISGGSFEKPFWSNLAKEITGEKPASLVTTLNSKNLITIGDMDLLPITDIVLIAPGTKKSSRDIQAIEAFKQIPNVKVIGVETVNTKPSRMGAYQLAEIGTVDNIDTIAGKIALVYMLESQEDKGHYGVKSTAEKLMPR